MKFRKIYIILILILLFNSFIFSSNIYAGENYVNLNIYSPSVLLMDAKSGKLLCEKNCNEKRYPASTTKMMTAILAVENCELSDIATVSYNAISSLPAGYTTANLQLGEELTIEQLLHVLLIPSANDAAIVLAEHIAGSTESFATMMNTKAAELGCKNTHFTNPSGEHDEDHYSTAYDLALIGRYAMTKPVIKTIVSTTSYTLPATNKYDRVDRTFTTTNDLIKYNSKSRADNYYYKYATGLKTGYTKYAKNCIVATAEKDGLEFIVVVLGAEQTENGLSARALDCKTLFEYGFNTYTIQKIKEKNSILKEVEIQNGTKETKHLNALISEDISVMTKQSHTELNLLPVISIDDNLKAPISKGQIIGNITYSVEDISYTTNLIAEHDVEVDNSFYFYFKIILFLFVLFLLFMILKPKKSKYRKKRINSNAMKVTRFR